MRNKVNHQVIRKNQTPQTTHDVLFDSWWFGTLRQLVQLVECFVYTKRVSGSSPLLPKGFHYLQL